MKSVHDLNQTELNELRSRWYHQHLDDGSLTEVLGFEVNDETDIPIDVVISYYEDDFFCNI